MSKIESIYLTVTMKILKLFVIIKLEYICFYVFDFKNTLIKFTKVLLFDDKMEILLCFKGS
jgi:hypothetical protein